MSTLIETSDNDGVKTIRFNRPDKKNALTTQMYQDLVDAIDAANGDKETGCILFLGHPGIFTAGNDIADFAQAAMSGGDISSSAVAQFLERIVLAEKPMVAGVDGLAIGVGTTMLLHCDHVIASDTSTFRTPFVDLGLIPEAGSTLLAPQLMGYQQAFWLLAMGESFGPEQAKDAGFVTQIVAGQELQEAALNIARAIAAKPPKAMEISRKMLRGDRSDVLARMREELQLFSERLQSQEAKQAFMAFMSK